METQSIARRIGILGGTFDPVHIGHLIIAQDALERFELSEVVFIPAAFPPHKRHLQQVDVQHRYNMLKLATEVDLRFSVSDLEVQRGGVSYTIDTIRHLRFERPDVQWVLIVGSDTLVDLRSWYKIDDLLELCDFASFMRPGEHDFAEIEKKLQWMPIQRRETLLSNLVEAHLVEISSTEIRMRVAEGLGIRYLVPPEVEMYICEHGLYRG